MIDAQEKPIAAENEMTPTVVVQSELAVNENDNEKEEVTVSTTQESTPTKELTTKAEIVARLKELAIDAQKASKQELDQLKQTFYKLHKAELLAATQAYLAEGGEMESFSPPLCTEEEEFKAEMALIKEKRTTIFLEQERQKEDNLKEKQTILERIKEMCESPERAGQAYHDFKELQNRWKEIKSVPADKTNELWKQYQHQVEQYYDMLKINIELREYDFKKNLEAKLHLCEVAEQLEKENDVIAAFKQLQNLHNEYREIGPVSKELREEVWVRFKAASTLINKKHQQHFEDIKAKEEENLAKKTTLCEKIEAIDYSTLTSFKEWDAKTKEVIELQTEWKTIGFAPQKANVTIFDRFRATCDNFFKQKSEFFKVLKESQNENLAKKQLLVEKAEALKENTEWRKTASIMSNLQKEWRTIGAVPRKHSDVLWKRFTTACDYFFEQRDKATSEQRGEEQENLNKKRLIIEQLSALLAERKSDAAQTVREQMNAWNEIGHVPFKEKDKIYKEYHELIDKLFKELNMGAAQRRLDSFKNNLRERMESSSSNLLRERERMFRAYEHLKVEIQTYENNLGFLNSSSKKGNSLVNEMVKKMDKLKDELALLRKKIETIDEEIRKE